MGLKKTGMGVFSCLGYCALTGLCEQGNTRAIQKVTSGELLTKQAMRKKLLYTKKIHTYINRT
jgi:hypothetical protein